MKSFEEYLVESRKTYNFKVGVAGEIPENFENNLEQGLEKFGVINLSSGKRTPISERPLDFPRLQNVEVTYYEAELRYPTTPQILEEYISQLCDVSRSHVIVRNPNDPLEDYQEERDNEVYEPRLTKHEMEYEDGQHLAGQNRVMDLLQELEKARQERTIDPKQSAPEENYNGMTGFENNNSSSPIGSRRQQ